MIGDSITTQQVVRKGQIKVDHLSEYNGCTVEITIKPISVAVERLREILEEIDRQELSGHPI